MHNRNKIGRTFPSFFRFIILLALLALCFPSRSLAQLTSQGNEQVIPYSGSTAFILSNSPVNPNLLVNTGTNTFVMNVNPPTNAARIYVTNDTANACSNLTVSMASSGNSSLNSFNNNLAAWQTINVATASGSFAGSAPITLPASGTIAVTSQPIIGTKIAVFVVLSSGCATTNIDVQVVFGVFSVSTGAVQGTVATGQPASGVNPVITGGVDVSNFARPFKACQDSSAVNCNGGNGYTLPIGAGGNQYSGVFQAVGQAVTSPNANEGPLVVAIGALQNLAAPALGPITTTSGTNGVVTSNTAGLLETRGGFLKQQTNANITGTLDVPANSNTAFSGNFSSCLVTIRATLVSGTTPTLNVYFQTGTDATNYTDRISFTQFTASGNQFAGISGATSINPTAFTNGTLAQTTVVNGPIGAYLNLHFVAGGTTPNWTANWGVSCY